MTVSTHNSHDSGFRSGAVAVCLLVLALAVPAFAESADATGAASVERLAGAVLAGNLSAALQIAETLPDKDQAKTVLKQIDTLRGVKATVMASFEQQKEAMVTVKTAGGELQGKVDVVERDRVRLLVPLQAGFIGKWVGYSALAPVEKFNRLGKEDTAGVDLARGLLALQGGYPEVAANYFERAGKPLGAAMADALEKQLTAKQREEKEAAAKKMYENMISYAGLAAGLMPEQVKPAVKKLALSETKLAKLRAGIARFRDEFAGTATLDAVDEALSALETIPRKPHGNLVRPTEKRIEAMVAKLRRDNPSQEEWNVTFENDKGEAYLKIYNHDKLTDISALVGLGLRRLALSGCSSLKDIRPLTGMELEYLSIAGTSVTDISVLADMPLTSLHLPRDAGNVAEILKSLPLESVRFGSDVRDLDFLRGKKLTYLYMVYAAVKDLSPLRGMLLKTLYLGREVHDLSALRDMELSFLYLSHCNNPDLGPLRGMPLESLYLVGAEIRVSALNLRHMKDMPLKTLVLDGVRGVDDAAPLARIKTLERLVIPPGIGNVDALRDLPNLKYIDTKYDAGWPQTAEMFWRIRDFRGRER